MSVTRAPLPGLIAIGLVIVTLGVMAQPSPRGAATQPVGPDGECPPGTTLVRPGRCQAPEIPPPSILDYRPRSTLVTEQHLVPKAKFPVVDIHSHVGPTPQTIDRLISEMDALNIRVLVNLSGGGSSAVGDKVDFIRQSQYADRFRVFANVDFDGAGAPDWAEKAVADLEEAARRGAIGLKIYKSLGLTTKDHTGKRLRLDDPALKPIWDTCARLNLPVIIHTAEPKEFFSPLDYKNERWLELTLFPSRRNPPGPDHPTFEALLEERDRMFKANPKTTFIGAHFGYYGHDLKQAAAALDSMPNVVLEVSAVLYEFGRQPRASREFFGKYQDRILFGKDAYEITEYPYYWRVFETGDEYFDYYRDYHAFWKLYGMELPDEVLRKVYYANALRVTPGLPQQGW